MTKEIKVITQVTLSFEQREKANSFENFSNVINKKLKEMLEILINIEFNNYRGQKVSLYNSNKSISIDNTTKVMYRKAGISLSNAVRYILDNDYL